MSDSYRISLTVQETTILLQSIRDLVDKTHQSMVLEHKLMVFLQEIQLGLRTKTSGLKKINAHTLGFDNVPDARPSVVVQKNEILTIPIEIEAKGPLHIKRWKLFKKWESNPLSLGADEIEIVEGYRLAEGLMSPEEVEAMNKKLFGSGMAG